MRASDIMKVIGNNGPQEPGDYLLFTTEEIGMHLVPVKDVKSIVEVSPGEFDCKLFEVEVEGNEGVYQIEAGPYVVTLKEVIV